MKRIAVVEDEVYMREELCDMLQKDGYLVEAITEYEDASMKMPLGSWQPSALTL